MSKKCILFIFWLLPVLLWAQEPTWPRWQLELTVGKQKHGIDPTDIWFPGSIDGNYDVAPIAEPPVSAVRALRFTRNGRWGLGIEGAWGAGHLIITQNDAGIGGDGIWEQRDDVEGWSVGAAPFVRWNWLRKPGVQCFVNLGLGAQRLSEQRISEYYWYSDRDTTYYTRTSDSLRYWTPMLLGSIGVNVAITSHWSVMGTVGGSGYWTPFWSLGLAWTPHKRTMW